MKADELKEEIAIELENIETVVKEVIALRNDLGPREPTVREKTAGAAFLSEFYNGIENILKRISYFYGVPLPSGDMWHLDLFKRFCKPSFDPFRKTQGKPSRVHEIIGIKLIGVQPARARTGSAGDYGEQEGGGQISFELY